jgi:hypothetical protein
MTMVTMTTTMRPDLHECNLSSGVLPAITVSAGRAHRRISQNFQRFEI